MARFLLDTNILVAYGKRRPEVAQRLSRIPAADLLLSSVVLAEIEYGIAKSTQPERNRRFYDVLLRGPGSVEFGEAAAKHYGPLRAELERRGQVIGPDDLMIAAQALANDVVLVTDNVGEFSRVSGLLVENWLA